MPLMVRRAFGCVMTVGLLCSGLLDPSFTAPARQDPTQTPDAGSLAAWSNLELRSTYLADSDETEVVLALLPVDPAAGEPRITMTFLARYEGRYPAVPPGSVEVRVHANPLTDPTVMRSPVMSLIVDEGSDDSIRLDLAGILPDTGVVLPGGRVDTAFFTVPLGLQLLALINAETIDGQAFGTLNFAFTPAQINALRDFANRILLPK